MRTYDDPFEAALASAVRREIEAIARSVVEDTKADVERRKEIQWQHSQNSESPKRKS